MRSLFSSRNNSVACEQLTCGPGQLTLTRVHAQGYLNYIVRTMQLRCVGSYFRATTRTLTTTTTRDRRTTADDSLPPFTNASTHTDKPLSQFAQFAIIVTGIMTIIPPQPQPPLSSSRDASVEQSWDLRCFPETWNCIFYNFAVTWSYKRLFYYMC